MTNSEIIKKICKHAGINETDDQLFFDSFVKRLLLELKPGDVLKLGNIGFLHLKNIRSSENGVQLKGIVFSESRRASRGDNVFLTSNDADIFHQSDFSFSPSLRKMEIPLGDEIDSGIFIPPSGNELLSFIDSKVENLFSKSEVIKDTANDEAFVIPAEIPGMKIIEKLEDISSFKSVLESEEKKVDPDKFQKIDSITSGLKEVSKDKISDKKLFKNKPIIVVKEGKEELKKVDESGYDKVRYNRINSLTSSGNQKSEEKKEEKITKPEIQSKKDLIIEQGTEKENVPVKEDIKPEIPKTDIKGFSVKKEPVTKEKIVPLKISSYQKEIKRKSKATIFIPIAVIIILVLAIYFLRSYNIKISGSSENIKLLPASNPVEIARSYDIPVDYPYEPKNQESLLFDGIDSSVYKGIKTTEAASVEKPVNEDDIPTVQQGAYKDLGDYIFKDGNIYFIQVSSWKYKSSAIEHMQRLIKEGYNASVERVISRSGDTYYRVRLGDFKSLAEAKKYIRNN
ncbi:MAG: SPOR domain-containing protein [Ignavibacteriaceae bacterium]